MAQNLASASPLWAPARRSPWSLGGRIPSLDGLRALSILLVVVAHVRTTTGIPYEWRRWLSAIPGNGALGVSIFFVISGFLITHLLVRERELAGRIDLRNFYIRRAFRILPIYYVFLVALWALRHFYQLDMPRRNFIAAGLFITNYAPFHIPNWIGHTWSLNVEEQFYLLWPLLLAPLGRRGGKWMAASLIVAATVSRIVCWFALPHDSMFITRIPFLLHTRIDTLMFGCLTALLYPSFHFQVWVKRIFHTRIHIVGFVFLFVVSPYLQTALSGWKHPGGPWDIAYLVFGGYTLESACIVLLLLWCVQNSSSRVGRVMNWRPVVHLGVISYSLYLWQQLFLIGQNHTWTGQFPMNLLYALLAAEASYWLIEKSFLRLRSRLTGRRRYEKHVPRDTISVAGA